MPLNRSLIGKEYPPSPPYEVCREKIREFAAAVGEEDPVFFSEEAARQAGYPDLVAPPTFAVVVAARAVAAALGDPSLGLDYSRVVHGEQEFRWRRPILAGERLVARARVADVASRGRNELLTLEAEIRSEAGEEVCLAVMTLVSRGTAPAEGGR
jgi:acyl dehydratase